MYDVANSSKVAKKMYLTLQEFLSRCDQNFQNNLKNSSEIVKTSNQGKIILNKQNQSKNIIWA
ncbi:Frataxin/CyaY [Nostoc flagelliforme CCNUN1]|uniref:Frataxin/CyaY n=1 Tax=Nostoc flagelliforme CCNUN1 TaxID=2038116 RepID=A0A2K8SVV2_9NOSO|nr:Frataxin/CyaY [Nostoc flagelliforme CCNUN1]